jgi:hypothetical protein
MTTLKGKHAGGDSKKVLKEKIGRLETIIASRDVEISQLLNRVTFVEMTNNQTQAENDLLNGKHFIRAMLIRLMKR